MVGVMIPYQMKFILREWLCRYHDDRDTLLMRDGDGKNVFESIFSTAMPDPGFLGLMAQLQALGFLDAETAWKRFEQRVLWFGSVDSWGLWKMYLENIPDETLKEKFRSYRSSHFGAEEGDEQGGGQEPAQ